MDIGNQFTTNMLAWCRMAALEEFNACDVKTYGPNILMDQDAFKHIILCAQAKKIKTIEDIVRVSSWTREPDVIERHRESLLWLILEHYPLPVENEVQTWRIQTGSCCSIEGHNSMFYL